MLYAGRPGISPALAVLIASGRIRHGNRILDVGCGTGTDALLLARWGFRGVDGIDPDGPSIAAARGRATRARLGHRVAFHHMGAEKLAEMFSPDTFDVVLHNLVANNLTKDKALHFRQVAAVMKASGLLVLHERVGKAHENQAPGRVRALAGLRRHFDLTPSVSTHLAEHPARKQGPHYARVALWLGTPKGRGRRGEGGEALLRQPGPR